MAMRSARNHGASTTQPASTGDDGHSDTETPPTDEVESEVTDETKPAKPKPGETTGVKVVKTAKKPKPGEPRKLAGRYKTTSFLKTQTGEIPPGTIVDLDEANARHFLKQNAIEAVGDD